MAPDQFDAWLTERFAPARTVADDGFSQRIMAQLHQRARQERTRQLILLPVLLLGAVLTAGYSSPITELLTTGWPQALAMPSLDSLSQGLVAGVQALASQQAAVLAAGAVTVVASGWLLVDEGF